MGKHKSRGNGQGTAYKRGKTWEACVIIGWTKKQPDGEFYPVKRRKGGFATKKEAIAACSALMAATAQRTRKTLQQVYDAWEPWYSPRVDESTMGCYRAAYKHFSAMQNTYIDMITARDLQECMDACTAGKRTHQNMKCVAGLLWAYAYDSDLVPKDVTENLYIGKGESKQREPLTEKEVEIIRQAIGKEKYAEYIYSLCYLGFRPGEFLKLKKTDLHMEDGVSYLVGGSKTEAGKERQVPVPAAIAEIVNARMDVPGTDLLFPQYQTNRRGEFIGYKEMSDAYFRESIFKPLMKRLGIAEGKVPYGARHTYSDKLKRAAGDDKTKAALMGHTDYAFTQSHYQSTDISDLKIVVDSIV